MVDSTLEDLIPKIQQLGKMTVSKCQIPGRALGIVRNQELAWFGGFGAADLEDGCRPGEYTIARIASVTKTFTTIAIMELRDEGHLMLDNPLIQH